MRYFLIHKLSKLIFPFFPSYTLIKISLQFFFESKIRGIKIIQSVYDETVEINVKRFSEDHIQGS